MPEDPRIGLIEEAIDRYGTLIQNYLFGLTKDWHAAEDIADKLWVFVYERFEDDQMLEIRLIKFKAYQLFCDYYRKVKRSKLDFTDEVPEQKFGTTSKDLGTPEYEEAFRQKFMEDYEDVGLSEKQFQALIWNCRDGYTILEIAERLGVGKSTVGDWIKDAKNKFAEYFAKA